MRYYGTQTIKRRVGQAVRIEGENGAVVHVLIGEEHVDVQITAPNAGPWFIHQHNTDSVIPINTNWGTKLPHTTLRLRKVGSIRYNEAEESSTLKIIFDRYLATGGKSIEPPQ